MGQKQSCSSYMARGVLHPIFGCPRMHLLSQLTSNSKRDGTKVGRTAGGVTSLGRQLVIASMLLRITAVKTSLVAAMRVCS